MSVEKTDNIELAETSTSLEKTPNCSVSKNGHFCDCITKIWECLTGNRSILKRILIFVLLVLYVIFLAFALTHNTKRAMPLSISSFLVFCAVLYHKVLKTPIVQFLTEYVGRPLEEFKKTKWHSRMKRLALLVTLTAFAVFLAVDTSGNRYRLMPLCGLALFIAVGVLCSTSPRQINWHPVVMGVVLQFLFGLLVLRWPWGYLALETVANATVDFLDYAQHGTRFVYGFVAEPPPICGLTPIFAFTVMQTLLYFGSVIAVLYYFGIIQFVLFEMAWLMQFALGTTAAESLNAAGCIFLGMTEGPLMIQPYFAKMTKSELHTVFASGFACIAGSLFIAYISFGACPVYLLSACFMSAPASISMSKLMLPETEESRLKNPSDLHLPPSTNVNVIDAISFGATTVIDVIVQIVANLVVFVALLTFVDHATTYVFSLVGWTLSFQQLLGYVFFPMAFLMGSSDAPDWSLRLNETLAVAQLMGTKTVINEFVAYKQMGQFVAEGIIQGRSQMIATYALCGFSNFASIGIQLATIGSLCPEKKAVVAEVILRALAAGAIACFMTACVAGILVDQAVTCNPVVASARHCVDLNQLLKMNSTFPQ